MTIETKEAKRLGLHGRRCRAKVARTGEPCPKPPIRGGFVCVAHGGKAAHVRRRAQERLRDMLADAIDPDRSLREAARIAFSDITKLFDDQGRLRPQSEWSEDMAAVVASVEVVRRNVDSGDGQQDDVIKIRLWNKPRALELLFKHLGLLKERVDVPVTSIEERLKSARQRVA